jgi:hemoglobin/transferrin/lactoferrin receptor protein
MNFSIVSQRRSARGFSALLMATVSMAVLLPAGVQVASAQERAASSRYAIPAGPLPQALNRFADASGLQLVYDAAATRSLRTGGFSGQGTPADVLPSLLAGTGLSYSFTNANTVTITNRVAAAHDGGAPAADGSLVLDTINVQGGGESSVYSPYETAAPTSHISGESIERFRGSSPADIFRGTPGVMSGEARNGAGSIDVNIRGMQGMGRVKVTVDDAENAMTVYQGYQGLSNRTFVDPDFIAGVDIQKGANVASGGIAGTVAMRTLNANDIVKLGDNWGVRVKGGFGTNTSTPEAGAMGGYAFPKVNTAPAVAPGSPDGMDRPSFLTPTGGSGSVVGAVKEEGYDLLAGYAYRKQGNYHAGKNGPSANPVNVGPRTICTTTYCEYWPEYVDNTGLTNYRAGEEVLNTQLETQSWLLKGNLRFNDEHSLQVGYTGFRSEAGDRTASALTEERGQAVQQPYTAGTTLDTGTLRYRWQPDDNDLFDLKASLWVTNLQLRNPKRIQGYKAPEEFGLPASFRSGSDTRMWGGDVTNKSAFSLADGSLDLTYGLSYLSEDTRPTKYSAELQGGFQNRDGKREEVGAFANAAYKPVDWLTLNAGLRYSHFWTEDRAVTNGANSVNPKPSRNEGGFSPSVGVTVEPFAGTQIYANYSNALRFPSLFETAAAFTVIPNPDLGPERNSSWEVGANFQKSGIFTESDTGMLKLGYFNWDVKDYISRQTRVFDGGTTGLWLSNIDRAKFSGLELSGRYENGGFTADLSANYYLNVEYCGVTDVCANASLPGDFAGNHIPPEYSIDLTVSQKLFEDRLTLGGRVSHVGPRAAGFGPAIYGAAQVIAPIVWKPYTLVDVFAEYKINDNYTAAFRVENLTDQYYVDPLGLVNQPGPGRTFYASLTGTFGGDQPLPMFSPPLYRGFEKMDSVDWTGLYAGFHAGAGFARTWGKTTALDGTPDPIAATEAADIKLNDIMIGGQAGFNWQLGNRVVLGVEADWSKTWMSGVQDTLTQEALIAPYNDIAGELQARTHYNIDWTGSIRGRLGYAFDNRWLAYGTGGVAFLKETQWRDQYQYYSDYRGEWTELLLAEKSSGNRTGFTVGGGAEYAINDRWSIKADYAYSRFGSKDFKFENARAGTAGDQVTGTEWVTPDYGFICTILPAACAPYEQETTGPGPSTVANGRKASNSLDFHAFKIGLNYRF